MLRPSADPVTLQELGRIQNRISFVYFEKCSVSRESNAVTATDEKGTVYLPAAMVATLLLGPGTRITHQAIALLADSGTSVVWVGQEGVRYYAHGLSLAGTTRLLEAQARLVSNRRSRLRVARMMYGMRFPGEIVEHLTMQQLRGREGARVRRVYQDNSHRTGVKWVRREYDPNNWDGSGDAVNQALSAANASLYGAAHAAIVALGCSPGLGFVHTGHARSFVYDIADLYKAELSIPVAFDVAANGQNDVGGRARRVMRDRLHESNLMDRMVRDITALVSEPELASANIDDEGSNMLWDERAGLVDGGTFYGDTP